MTNPLHKDLTIPKDELHIWTLHFERAHELEQKARMVLSPEEINIAGKFHQTTDRVNYILRKSFLRLVLQIYTGIPPHGIVYTTNKFGKPSLKTKGDLHVLHFSSSSSHECAVFAFSLEREVGIDIEYKSQNFIIETAFSSLFSEEEKRIILAEADTITSFYNIWTRKEAIGKALGTGITDPQLSAINVFAESPIIVSDNSGKNNSVYVESIQIETTYAGALAVVNAHVSGFRHVYYSADEVVDKLLQDGL